MIIDQTAARRALVLTVVGTLNNAAVQEKNAILETEPADMREAHARYETSLAQALADADRLIASADGPDRRRANEEFKAGIADFKRAADKSIALSLQNDKAGAALLSNTEVRAARVKVMALAEARIRSQDTILVQARSDLAALGRAVLLRLYLFAGLGLVLSLGLLAGTVMVFVVRPLAAINRCDAEAGGWRPDRRGGRGGSAGTKSARWRSRCICSRRAGSRRLRWRRRRPPAAPPPRSGAGPDRGRAGAGGGGGPGRHCGFGGGVGTRWPTAI